jgi:hypothetical protein
LHSTATHANNYCHLLLVFGFIPNFNSPFYNVSKCLYMSSIEIIGFCPKFSISHHGLSSVQLSYSSIVFSFDVNNYHSFHFYLIIQFPNT